MKRNRKGKRQSFIKLYISSILTAAIILALIFLVVNMVQTRVLNSRYIAFEQIAENLELLKEERYDELPANLLKNGNFAIYDGSYENVFAVGEKALTQLSRDEIMLIPSVPIDGLAQRSYLIGEEYRAVIRFSLDEGEGEMPEAKYALIDHEGNIVGGNLIQNMSKLDERDEFLLNGILDGSGYVETYEYITKEGEGMTLLFFDANYRGDLFILQDDIAAWYGAFMILFVIVVLIVLAVLMSKKAERSIRPIQDAISAYKRGDSFELRREDVPVEFDSAVDAFNDLRVSLKQEQEEKQRMLADISHDLRTPLTVIKGYSQAFIDGKVEKEQYLKYTRIINLKAEFASKLLESLMEYARLDHPDYSPDFETVDFTKLCVDYSDVWAEEFGLSNIAFNADITTEPIYVSCDIKMIYRLFENIFQNAIKHGGSEVDVSVKRVGDSVRVVISDEGEGISADMREGLFNAFVTGNKARTTDNGVGLGLAISKKIAVLHGGSIRLVQSGNARGATFEILLPISGNEQK